jgi:hypothetical protein
MNHLSSEPGFCAIPPDVEAVPDGTATTPRSEADFNPYQTGIGEKAEEDAVKKYRNFQARLFELWEEYSQRGRTENERKTMTMCFKIKYSIK